MGLSEAKKVQTWAAFTPRIDASHYPSYHYASPSGRCKNTAIARGEAPERNRKCTIT